ncbi:integrase [Bacillus wiedmannii]|uniref:Uncharacterized protein n=1 Tax=Bacillus wiedmannii TaxID=1890302 RepID=A0A242Z0N7_9BACI|nr:integrase [Bacillus wiedmannii]MED3126816.1 hypothetical protein [Bacillus wiedmannii]OTX86023.1 hypothetical protein BK730_21825 [Bacillus wiedmannii]
MNGSVRKDKKTDKYFYIVANRIGHSTGKRKIRKENLLPKRSRKYFNTFGTLLSMQLIWS